MSSSVFLIILFGALCHASWNALVKFGGNPLYSMSLIGGIAGLLALCLLPFLPFPAAASWPYLISSSVLQVIYYLLIAKAYQVANMSVIYPLMRGVSPLLVTLLSLVLFPNHLTLAELSAIALLCAGMLFMVRFNRIDFQGTRWALVNAAVIALYTLIDGKGVRLSDSSISYGAWLFFLCGMPLLLWHCFTAREFRTFMRTHWRKGILAGVGSMFSYGIALWAMMRAPIALVSALRETSILFGLAISICLLKERPGKKRIIGAMVMLIGVIALRLA